MKIATRLQFNALLFAVAVLIISLLFAMAFRLHWEAFERSILVDGLMRGAYELNSLSNRYLRYPGERPKEQWILVYETLANRLSSDVLLPLHSEVVVQRMRQNLSDMRALFSDLVSIDEKRTAAEQTGAGAAFADRRRALIADLIIKGARDVSLDASRLIAVSNTQVSKIARRISLLLPIAGILLTAVTVLVTARMSRSIHRGIDALRAGADAVAQGNLDYGIGLKTRDELGQLSDVFNHMTANLKAITVSRSELLKEMAERRRTEEALKENQRFLQAIIETAPACIKLVASDGTLLKVNDAGLRIIEAGSAGEVEGKDFYQLVSSRHRRAFRDLTDAVFRGGSGTLEFEAVSLKGRRLWLNTHAAPLYDNEGRITALLGITMDTTVRKRTEEALRISEENYRAIFNASSDAIFIHAIDSGAILDVNRTMLQMYKYGLEEVRNLSVEDLSAGTSGYTQDDALRLIRRAVQGDPQIFEWRAKDKKGDLFWVEVSLKQVTLEGRDRLLAIVRDIRERKQVEIEFRRISRQNELILEYAGEGIFGLDLQGRVTFVNAVAAHMLGYTRQELMGTHSHTTWHYKKPDDAPYPSEDCPIYAAYAEGTIRSGEEVFWKKDGTGFPIEYTSRPLYEGNRIAGAVVIYRDITQRKNAEEELKKLLEELARSNRELEQFAYVASHDLQEPLRMVASYVQLLERKYKGSLDEKADKYIFFSVDGVRRMQKLIDGLLAYSRVSRGSEFTPIDANKVLDEAVANLSASIRESHANVTRDELPSVVADETQLSQVFQNLIANAIKFRKREVEPAVHVSAKRAGAEWIFSVNDNGIGIEPQYYDRIFQIFQRLHSRDEYPGTGIGLSLCKRIIERHGGRIWLESAPGKGATFFFTIPLREKKSRPALAAA